MRALVSDATGIVGRPLVARLLSLGWDVLGITDTPELAQEHDKLATRAWPKKLGAFGKSLDDVDVAFLPDLVEGVNYVHIAKHVGGLIEALDKAQVKRCALLSSAQVYGPEALAGGYVSEAQPTAEVEEGIGAAALALETTLRHCDPSMDCRVLRPLSILTASNPWLVEQAMQLIDGKDSAWSQTVLHSIALDDLVDQFAAAGTRNDSVNHVFNLAGPEAIQGDFVAAEMSRLSHVLQDQSNDEIQVRPVYPMTPPVLQTQKVEALLHVRAQKPAWFGLSELAQAAVHKKRADGEIEAIRFKMPFYIAAIESGDKPLHGKVAVVTGVTSGIGQACAMQLSRLGAKVIGVARSAPAGQAMVAQMADLSYCTEGQFIQADLSSLADVRTLAETLSNENDKIDILINNAGAVFPERGLSVDGFELSLALNLLSPFLLTELLLPKLQAAEKARIINLGSDAHKNAPLDLADFQSELSYDAIPVYGKAKSGLVMATYCLAEKLAGTNVTANIISPGAVRTNIWTFNAADDEGLGPNQKQMRNTMRERARMQMLSPEQSGGYVTNLAVDPALDGESGYYVDKDQPAESGEWTYDRELALQLWDRCAQLTGLNTETA